MNVAGLVASFWVSTDEQKNSEVRWQSESEIGPERACHDCEHEWMSEEG